MKKRTMSVALLIGMCLIGSTSYAKDTQPELVKMRATAYPDTGNLTYSGTKPHYGTAGASKDMLGKTIIMYQRLPNDEIGEIIGYFEIEDTGSAKGAREGHVIDVWRPNLDECQEFMDLIYSNNAKGKVWVQFIDDAQG